VPFNLFSKFIGQSFPTSMSRKYKFKNPEGIYFISFATVYWIEVFIRNKYKDIVIESWKHCQKEKGLNIYDWIIVSGQVHMI
jgi:REP element-mobilizing transposase RayT